MHVPQRARSLLHALAIAIATCGAAAAPRLHYDGPRTLPLASRGEAFQLRKQLYPALKQAGIERIELVAGSESLVQERSSSGMMYLDGLPVQALHGVLLMLPAESLGAEIDLLVEGRGAPDDPDRIWTLRRDLSGGIVVWKGEPPLALDGPDPTPQQLAERFGIGALEDSPDVQWTADERRALEKALELLTPRELELIAGTSFRRARREKHGNAGAHSPSWLGEPGRVWVFDRAFERVNRRPSYVGALDRAVPYSVFVILHEVGHALARAERRQLLLQRREEVESYEISRASHQESTREYALTPDVGPAARTRRPDLEDEIARTSLELRARFGKIQKLDAELEALRTGLAGVEKRYAALPAALGGPTSYGRISAKESFAEAFALYHVDPDSLRWIAPQVHTWFEASTHLLGERPLSAVAAPAEPDPRTE
jgi:hypothetical protein